MEKKRKLKKFASQADYDAQKGSVMGIPHVVLLNDTRGLVYKPKNGIDYSKEYFTIINTGDDVLTIEAIESGTSLSYNLSSVDTWNEVENDEIQVQPQEKVSFKSFGEPNADGGACQFICEGDTTCSVQGNIMSLLYGDEFENKTDLTGHDYVFSDLFDGCTTLTDASNLILPATTLSSYCYSSMFRGCTSLTTAPELPATTLTEGCYSYMFNACASLTEAPELPAITLADSCYVSMFNGCTNLTVAPELPATTLTSHCYVSMFNGCTSLATAPELPAITLSKNCYQYMFNGCSSLTHITMLATDISAVECLYYWAYGVASSGTFIKHPNMTSLPSGVNGIPDGWEINLSVNNTPCIINTLSTSLNFYYNDGLFMPSNTDVNLLSYYTESNILSMQPECDIYVYISDKKGGVITTNYLWAMTSSLNDVMQDLNITSLNNLMINIVELVIYEDNSLGYYYLVEPKEPFIEKDYMRIVSLEDDNTITFSQTTQYSINGSDWKRLYGGDVTVNTGDKVYLKNSSNNQRINSTKLISVEGNIMSLLFGVDFEDKTDLTGYDYAFYGLFNGCKTLINASNLILPATTLAERCYYYMFRDCTGLTVAPELPATTLASYCYSYMFQGCTGLTVAPALPATTLANFCYYEMFYNCTSLTVAPELPAKTLTSSCYRSMFSYCTSLTTAPELPATTLADYCYYYMFYNCTSLTVAPELPATTLADYCYSSMFSNCTSLTTAPVLPATKLAVNCYHYMFYGCSELNNITMLATDISASSCLVNWVNGVASSGVFVKSPSMTSLPSGTSGIPTGWTVEDYVN